MSININLENHVTDVLTQGASERGKAYVGTFRTYKITDVDSGKVRGEGRCRVLSWRYSTAIDGDAITLLDVDDGKTVYTNIFEASFGDVIKDPMLLNKYQALQAYVCASHSDFEHEVPGKNTRKTVTEQKHFWAAGMVLTDENIQKKDTRSRNRPILTSYDAYGETMDLPADVHPLDACRKRWALAETTGILHAVMRAVLYAKKHGYARVQAVVNTPVDETTEAYAMYKTWMDAHGDGIDLSITVEGKDDDTQHSYMLDASTKMHNAGLSLNQSFYNSEP